MSLQTVKTNLRFHETLRHSHRMTQHSRKPHMMGKAIEAAYPGRKIRILDALKLTNGICSETWLRDLKQGKTGDAQKQVCGSY